MKFPYRPASIAKSEAFPQGLKLHRPIIRVTLKHRKQTLDIYGVVDSGADHCIFPSDAAQALGLDPKLGKKGVMYGINRQPTEVFFHQIEILISGRAIPVYAGFSDNCPPLLGQLGFFENFEVRLNFKRKELELKTYPNK
jgi:hypothetical protein